MLTAINNCGLPSPLPLPPTTYLEMEDGEQLAYMHHPGRSPGIVFLPGYKSTMRSKKPTALYSFCHERCLEFTTLDYYGHGESSCSNERKETIGRWKNDAIAVMEHVSTAPTQILVGSSMGAWLMILIAQARKDGRDFGGLLGIGSACDFTSTISGCIRGDKGLSEQMQSRGYCDMPTEYDAKGFFRIYQDFLNEAEQHFVLSNKNDNRIDLDIPLRLIHGKEDKDIGIESSEALMQEFRGQDKELIVVDGGNHRLSEPEEIGIILNTLNEMLDEL